MHMEVNNKEAGIIKKLLSNKFVLGIMLFVISMAMSNVAFGACIYCAGLDNQYHNAKHGSCTVGFTYEAYGAGGHTVYCKCDHVSVTGQAHFYLSSWSKDSKGHWHACKWCGYQQSGSWEAHIYGSWSVSNGYNVRTCSVCGHQQKYKVGSSTATPTPVPGQPTPTPTSTPTPTTAPITITSDTTITMVVGTSKRVTISFDSKYNSIASSTSVGNVGEGTVYSRTEEVVDNVRKEYSVTVNALSVGTGQFGWMAVRINNSNGNII